MTHFVGESEEYAQQKETLRPVSFWPHKEGHKRMDYYMCSYERENHRDILDHKR